MKVKQRPLKEAPPVRLSDEQEAAQAASHLDFRSMASLVVVVTIDAVSNGVIFPFC